MPRPKGSQNKDKTKKKKDKDAPKKGKSAFFYYLDKMKEEARRNNPNAKHPEIISLLSKQWNKLSPLEKQPFEQLANKDRERFHREKEDFIARNKAAEEAEEAEAKNGKRKMAGIRDTDEPKMVKKVKADKGGDKKQYVPAQNARTKGRKDEEEEEDFGESEGSDDYSEY